MPKPGTEQHYFTVRGRGFDEKQWKAVVELADGIIARAKEAGISASFEADARCLMVTSSDNSGSPLVIWRKGEPGIPKEVTTRGRYDALVQSILTAAKKVAPDIFEMTAPDGRDYRRLLAKQEDRTIEQLKKTVEDIKNQKEEAFQNAVKAQQWPNPNYQPGTKAQTHVQYSTLPKKNQTEIRHRWNAEYGHRFDDMAERATKQIREAEKAKTEAHREKEQAQDAAKKFKNVKQKAQDGAAVRPKKKASKMNEHSIRKAAIRVAATTDDKSLKTALLEILRDTVPTKEAKDHKDEKEGRHEEGKSVDVGDFLKEKGHHEDAAKWEEHEGDMGKKSSAARLFPDVYQLAWEHVRDFAQRNTDSKVASGSTAQRVAAATRLAKEWIQDAIKRPGRVREYLGVPEGKDIPMSKLDTAIEKVKGTGNKSLLSALLLAKRLKGMK